MRRTMLREVDLRPPAPATRAIRRGGRAPRSATARDGLQWRRQSRPSSGNCRASAGSSDGDPIPDRRASRRERRKRPAIKAMTSISRTRRCPTVAEKPFSATFWASATPIDPRVQGTVSLSSGRAVPRKDLLFVLEKRACA